MLHWLSLWGRRLWRSCCYPFQFLPFAASRPKATPEASGDSDSRDFPSIRAEAIRQGVMVPPEDETPLLDLAWNESLIETDLELEDELPLSSEGSVDSLTDGSFFAPDALDIEEPFSSPATSREGLNPKRTLQSAGAELPFDWVWENRLAIGPLPRKGWEKDFEAQGIQVIISLSNEAEGKLPQAIAQQFCCVRVTLPDSRDQRALTLAELEDAVDLVHWYVQKRQPIYMHCLAGVEQSPLVAIAYLTRHRAMDLLDAVGWLSHVHSLSRPIPAQLQVVREYLQRC